MAVASHNGNFVRPFPERVPVAVSAVDRAQQSSIDVARVAGERHKLVPVPAARLERETGYRRQGELRVRG